VVLILVTIVLALFWPERQQPEEVLHAPAPERGGDGRATRPGSFPMPPMDLQVPPSPRARRAVAAREPANVGAAAPAGAPAATDEEG
jgi:NADH-quinone oxidoreductase subunit H